MRSAISKRYFDQDYCITFAAVPKKELGTSMNSDTNLPVGDSLATPLPEEETTTKNRLLGIIYPLPFPSFIIFSKFKLYIYDLHRGRCFFIPLRKCNEGF